MQKDLREKTNLKFSHVFAKLELECSVRALFVAQIWTVTNLGLVQISNG